MNHAKARCPACGIWLRINSAGDGAVYRCPKCRHEFILRPPRAPQNQPLTSVPQAAPSPYNPPSIDWANALGGMPQPQPSIGRGPAPPIKRRKSKRRSNGLIEWMESGWVLVPVLSFLAVIVPLIAYYWPDDQPRQPALAPDQAIRWSDDDRGFVYVFLVPGAVVIVIGFAAICTKAMIYRRWFTYGIVYGRRAVISGVLGVLVGIGSWVIAARQARTADCNAIRAAQARAENPPLPPEELQELQRKHDQALKNLENAREMRNRSFRRGRGNAP